MLALMKTRHTDQATEIFVSLPASASANIGKFIQDKLRSLGHTVRHLNDEGEELITFDEVFPEAHPGLIMRGLRNRDELTQQELAGKLGIAQTRVSEMESGKRSISVKMAKQLAEVFGTSHKVFL
jgi:DNA-binding XRE family transcriptional regulator